MLNWKDETVVIVATGPSAAEQPLEKARGTAKFIAIKSSWRLCPWADVVYGTDRGWWLANNGAIEFKGVRITASPTIHRCFPGVQLAKLAPGPQIRTDGRLGGSHSGAHAINLAINFGAKRIVLVGFDMNMKSGAHWKENDPGVARAEPNRMVRWRLEMDAQIERFRELQVEVINCSMQSTLTAYKKRQFSEVF
jgi:hypothetical protein